MYQNLGKYERSIQLSRRALDINPDFPPDYPNLAWSYLFLERYGDAENTIRQAAERKISVPDLLVLAYVIAFYKNDRVAMESSLKVAKDSTEASDWITYIEGSVLAYSGQLQPARGRIRQAVNLSQQAHQPERAATFEAGAAVREAFFENFSEARQRARRALEISRSRDVEYGAAFALAFSGDEAGSRALAGDLAKRFPEDTCVKFTYLPVYRALLALNHHDSTGAIEQLQAAAPYDLVVPCSWFGIFGNLYAPYVRGQAFLAEHRYAEAIAEFQKILDHPGIVFTDPVRVVARLQLGRALRLAGDKNKARTAYEDFLALWKNADPEIPLLKEAKGEYAKL
jgi:tetratricopeptide (TPR) repeat protein